MSGSEEDEMSTDGPFSAAQEAKSLPGPLFRPCHLCAKAAPKYEVKLVPTQLLTFNLSQILNLNHENILFDPESLPILNLCPKCIEVLSDGLNIIKQIKKLAKKLKVIKRAVKESLENESDKKVSEDRGTSTGESNLDYLKAAKNHQELRHNILSECQKLEVAVNEEDKTKTFGFELDDFHNILNIKPSHSHHKKRKLSGIKKESIEVSDFISGLQDENSNNSDILEKLCYSPKSSDDDDDDEPCSTNSSISDDEEMTSKNVDKNPFVKLTPVEHTYPTFRNLRSSTHNNKKSQNNFQSLQKSRIDKLRKKILDKKDEEAKKISMDFLLNSHKYQPKKVPRRKIVRKSEPFSFKINKYEEENLIKKFQNIQESSTPSSRYLHNEEKTDYHCAECQKYFKTSKTLKKHRRVVHEEKNFGCDFCVKRFSSEAQLEAHISYKHESNNSLATIPPNPAASSTNIAEIDDDNDEYENCQESDVVTCKICQVKISYGYLKTHIKRHKNEMPHNCPHENCTYGSHSLAAVNLHVKAVHLKIKDFKCSYCPAAFSRKNTLSAHVRMHDGSHVKVKCEICNKFFYNKSVLNNHIRATHIKELRHFCEICGKGFPVVSYLTAHLKTCAKRT